MDYGLKFVASPTSRCLSGYARDGLRKWGFTLLLANTWMHAHMCLHLLTQRAGLLNGYSIDFVSTRRLVSTDGDEVSGKFFIRCLVAIYFLAVIR